MSVHVMSWVLRNSNARLGERLVLIVLADHAKEDGTSAWPSVATIADEAVLSQKQVQRCLAGLKREKRITLTGKSRNGTNVYKIEMTEKKHHSHGGDILSGATNPTLNGDRMSPEPSLEQPSVILSGEPRKRNEIWDTLTHMFGEPATPSATRARGKVCAELKTAGASPDEILQRGRNWPSHFDGATLTEHALVKHWHTLARKPLRRR